MFRNETVLGLDERTVPYDNNKLMCLNELLRAEASRSHANLLLILTLPLSSPTTADLAILQACANARQSR